MATKAQIAANRRNAKKCTGPTSEAGKAASSMNNLRHGLRASTLILPGETQEDFDKILAAMQQEYQPQSDSEHFLVKEAATARWNLLRAAAYEAGCNEKNPDIEACCALFSRMTLVTSRLQRSFLKFYHELERIKAARAKPPEQPDEPEESDESDEVPDTGINLYWVNPRTGVRTLAAQSPEAKRLSDLHKQEQPTDPPANTEMKTDKD
jgi:hypothetical protein